MVRVEIQRTFRVVGRDVLCGGARVHPFTDVTATRVHCPRGGVPRRVFDGAAVRRALRAWGIAVPRSLKPDTEWTATITGTLHGRHANMVDELDPGDDVGGYDELFLVLDGEDRAHGGVPIDPSEVAEEGA